MGTEERWWINEDWRPPVGAHAVEALGAVWVPVACLEHSVLDEDDESRNVRVGDGFQADCVYCAHEADSTRQHINQVDRSNR